MPGAITRPRKLGEISTPQQQQQRQLAAARSSLKLCSRSPDGHQNHELQPYKMSRKRRTKAAISIVSTAIPTIHSKLQKGQKEWKSVFLTHLSTLFHFCCILTVSKKSLNPFFEGSFKHFFQILHCETFFKLLPFDNLGLIRTTNNRNDFIPIVWFSILFMNLEIGRKCVRL